MTSRLSQDSQIDIYNRGVCGFLLNDSDKLLPKTTIDLKAITALPRAKEKIQGLKPQELYLALKAQGVEDHLEVLSMVSKEQLVCFMDYDVWTGSDFIPGQILRWLILLRKISPSYMLQCFKSLDEEYQIATFISYIRVYDEEQFELLSEFQQDSIYPFPGNKFFYQITHNLI